MGGGVCLLIALTGVAATTSGAATLSTDAKPYVETTDTAQSIDFTDVSRKVATPITPKPEVTTTVSQATISNEAFSKPLENEDTTTSTVSETSWDGPVLNSFVGIVQGPSGSETYYNLDMSGVVSIMKNLGYDYNYWVRDDGVKMYGDYVMCAADLSIRPKGTILETSLGPGRLTFFSLFSFNFLFS